MMHPKFRPRIFVIGGGLGGLAAAIRCARAGCQVTLADRQAEPGGKMRGMEWNGYHWDVGPSLLTMPHVLRDLWQSVGANLEEDLRLIRLDSTCRYHWRDGTVIDENADFWSCPEVAAFLSHARGLYELSADVFLHHPLQEWRDQVNLKNIRQLRHFPKLADPRSLATTTESFFPSSPHLRQIFQRFATYNGSHPWRTPSAFHIIAGVQQRFGGWYPEGGMARVAQAMTALAKRLGVQIECATEVERIQRNGGAWTVFLRPTGGGAARPANADGVICNQDALTATKRFLDPAFEPRRALSTSGFVVVAAVEREDPRISHHNIFFSDDYPREFREMFDQGEPATDPTIYLCLSAKSDVNRAPPGCANWFLLVNAPPVKPGVDWQQLAPRYADSILGGLSAFGIPDPRPFVRHLKTITPADFAARDLSPGGALYGYASHGAMASFLRPSMVSPEQGFVFAGGATHPGGGVPLVVLSGQMAARLLMKQIGGPEIAMPDAAR